MLCWRQWRKSMARLDVVGKAFCIISGGQTGVDRACLAWAIRRGLQHGGWCPKGRRAEDGEIPARYKLLETPSARPAQRTKWNVRDSEATVIFSQSAKLSGGSWKTWEACKKFQQTGAAPLRGNVNGGRKRHSPAKILASIFSSPAECGGPAQVGGAPSRAVCPSCADGNFRALSLKF